jgi:hypothetical protein
MLNDENIAKYLKQYSELSEKIFIPSIDTRITINNLNGPYLKIAKNGLFNTTI